MRVQSVDALINQIPEAQPIDPSKSPVNQENDVKNVENSEKLENSGHDELKNASDGGEKPTQPTDTDEYGTKVEKKSRMYTEEEVQNMIRERLKRGAFRHEQQQQQQQPTPQQQQQAHDIGFQYNADSEETWTQQLETFVRNTINKVSTESYQKQREYQERQAQADFEARFYSGMEKYPDFVETMSDKPVTNDMMKAVRGIDNPAAFLYAAAKKQPDELRRIASIPDPAIQMLEMGRLHERMVKKSQTSNSPKPLGIDRSDIPDKRTAKRSIDHLIAEDARSRVRR